MIRYPFNLDHPGLAFDLQIGPRLIQSVVIFEGGLSRQDHGVEPQTLHKIDLLHCDGVEVTCHYDSRDLVLTRIL